MSGADGDAPDPRTGVPDDHGDKPDGRSGRAFVLTALVLVLGFVLLRVFATPLLRDQLGIGPAGATFSPPPEPTTAAGGTGDDWTATVRWDDAGVCVDVVYSDGALTRTCTRPDPLRAIWEVDAPAAPIPVVVVGTTPDVEVVVADLDDGREVRAPARGAGAGLPASFAVLDIPPGRTVRALSALDANGVDLVTALCGRSGRAEPAILDGGCSVPAEGE